MVMVRSNQGGGPAQQLTNDAGEVTSHIQGFFTRTIRLMEKGIKPVYVFDGGWLCFLFRLGHADLNFQGSLRS